MGAVKNKYYLNVRWWVLSFSFLTILSYCCLSFLPHFSISYSSKELSRAFILFSSGHFILYHPWSLFTFVFVHKTFLHLAINLFLFLLLAVLPQSKHVRIRSVFLFFLIPVALTAFSFLSLSLLDGSLKGGIYGASTILVFSWTSVFAHLKDRRALLLILLCLLISGLFVGFHNFSGQLQHYIAYLGAFLMAYFHFPALLISDGYASKTMDKFRTSGYTSLTQLEKKDVSNSSNRKRKKKKGLFHRLSITLDTLLLLLCCLGYLSALSSPYISPRTMFWPVFCNLTFPFWMLFLLLLLIYLLLRRKWLRALPLLLLLAFSTHYISAFFAFHPFATHLSHSPKTFKVLTYNVMGFQMRNKEGASAIDFINKEDADIVCLQEGMLNMGLQKNRRAIRTYFSKKYRYIHIYENQTNHSQGCVLLSKYPILEVIPISYPSYGNGSVIYVLEKSKEERIMVVNNHMESYALSVEERSKIKGMVKNKMFYDFPLIFFNLEDRLGPKLAVRAYAAEKVKQDLEKLQEKYKPKFVLVCGDLNDTPMSYTYSKIRGNRRDAFQEVGNGMGISFNEKFFWFRIDHIFYSGDINAVSARVIPNLFLSDHNPMLVEFSEDN